MAADLRQGTKITEPWSEPITGIAQCYAARHLSRSGAAEYGAKTFGFKDVMFVEVSVNLSGGRNRLNRTLAVQDKEGRWKVHPRPDLVPLLSMGLSAEDRSEKEFSGAVAAAPATTPASSPSVSNSPAAVQNRHSQLAELYRRLLSDVDLKSAKNPKMQELYDRYSGSPGAGVGPRLTELVTAILELSATDSDARALVDRYGIQKNAKRK